ncbi:Rrf2 family transcriptional regulator [Caldovatus aquaticus]|uniref:Rrf2 family transcriptional regulator n=1 Tax=Caldovatus aquaticus TaxID=2865671 RepID=A0ABS7EXU7_9PROT|nr:Rrf2 family transcriptional regulator [Caldovatus aquaticus]MBW8268187.1 Rrf2 family transcriptional regulator [Caldovatus aquaticus]
MVATRFAVAVHILLLLAIERTGQATSARIAASVNTNPVVIRRIAGRLARAGLIRVRRGPGGAELARPPESITLAEVWRAIHPPGTPLLSMHRPNREDPVGGRVPELLGPAFRAAEQAMLDRLSGTTLASLLEGTRLP